MEMSMSSWRSGALSSGRIMLEMSSFEAPAGAMAGLIFDRMARQKPTGWSWKMLERKKTVAPVHLNVSCWIEKTNYPIDG